MKLRKLALRIDDEAPLSQEDMQEAVSAGIGVFNDSLYGIELTAHGERVAYPKAGIDD